MFVARIQLPFFHIEVVKSLQQLSSLFVLYSPKTLSTRDTHSLLVSHFPTLRSSVLFFCRTFPSFKLRSGREGKSSRLKHSLSLTLEPSWQRISEHGMKLQMFCLSSKNRGERKYTRQLISFLFLSSFLLLLLGVWYFLHFPCLISFSSPFHVWTILFNV